MRRIFCSMFALLPMIAVAGDFPDTRREIAVNSYHGVDVDDPYQWLEDWSSEEVKAWSAAQNAAARAYLDALPNRDVIAQRVGEVMGGDTTSYYAAQRIGDQAWFLKYAPPKQQPFLVQIDPSGDPGSERVVFDPEEWDESGSTSIEWYRVSPNARLVAIALTVAGAEIADLHIFDLRSGERIDSVVPRVNGPTAGGDLSWDADSGGFYYTRYPRAGERPPADQNFYQQLWHRKLGTSLDEDRYELGELFERIAEIRVVQHLPSGKTLATMQYGDSGKFQLYVRDPGGAWHRVADYDDRLVQAVFLSGDTLLALSRKDSPRGTFVRMDISDLPKTKLETFASPADFALASNFYGDPTFVVHNDRIYAKTLAGGPEGLKVYDLEGADLPAPDLGISGVGQIVPWGDGVLVRQYSYTAPENWLLFDGRTSSRHALSSTSPVNFEGTVVERRQARSKDGTEVPVNIIMARGTKLDGSSPLLLTGYGGYGISRSPAFKPTRKLWLEQGGIFAEANLRGGGEFGDEWHQQGMLTKKQNVFDDFHAVMKYLVEAGYTSAGKLAIEGGSNGGLLMGAMITQHPEDFGAVISHVGIYDSLRVELSPNGAFNIPEFGTVENPDHFKALYAYSPYHNARKAAYPPTLFMTGENDGRVDPMHSRKMTAMLQFKTTSGNPVLLRTSGNTGHGSGTPYAEVISQQVDRLVFLFDSLGMEYRAPQSPSGDETAVRVALETDRGTILVEVYPQAAPLSANDFLHYVDEGLYDDAGFYRVVRPDNDNGTPVISAVQGGVLDTEAPPAGIPHETTAVTGLRHVDGTVSIARGPPGTGSAAAFFIVLGDQPSLDFGGMRNPDGQGFAAFGKVIDGMELVREINAIKADAPTDDDYVRGQILVEPVRFRAKRLEQSE